MKALKIGQRVGLQLPDNAVIGGKIIEQTKSRTYVESDDGDKFRFTKTGAALGRKARMVSPPAQSVNGHVAVELVADQNQDHHQSAPGLLPDAAMHVYLNYLFPAPDYDLTTIKTIVRDLGVTLPQIQAAVQTKYAVSGKD